MIGFDLGASEGIIILIVVLVLFGGSQVPKLARNLGRAEPEPPPPSSPVDAPAEALSAG